MCGLAQLLVIPAEATLQFAQKLHEVRIELHDDNVEDVEEKQCQSLVPLHLPVPGEPDKQDNR